MNIQLNKTLGTSSVDVNLNLFELQYIADIKDAINELLTGENGKAIAYHNLSRKDAIKVMNDALTILKAIAADTPSRNEVINGFHNPTINGKTTVKMPEPLTKKELADHHDKFDKAMSESRI